MSFEPDWISPPGHTIGRLLERRGIQHSHASSVLGGGITLTDILAGRSQIDQEIADLLAHLVGGSRSFWLEREREYRNQIRRAEGSAAQDDSEASWLSELPVTDMKAFGWIEKHGSRRSTVESCLRFFGVGSVPEWRDRYAEPLRIIAFRRSPTFDQTPGAVATWLRAASLNGQPVTQPWSRSELRRQLPDIRALTRIKSPNKFLPALKVILERSGVSLAIAPSPSGCRASGATYFTDGIPTIALSFRYKTDDHFWFTLFHEISHLLLHDGKMVFIDDDGGFENSEELEADSLATEILVPAIWRSEIENLSGLREVIRLARDVGVSPGILVGYMQHEGLIPYSQMNRLKVRYRWDLGQTSPTL